MVVKCLKYSFTLFSYSSLRGRLPDWNETLHLLYCLYCCTPPDAGHWLSEWYLSDMWLSHTGTWHMLSCYIQWSCTPVLLYCSFSSCYSYYFSL